MTRRLSKKAGLTTAIAKPANIEQLAPTTEASVDGAQRSNGADAEQAQDTESFRPATVELWSGIVTGERIFDADGGRSVPCLVGEMFFIDIVEVDGGRCGMWNGRSLEQAMIEARFLAVDCDVELVDLVRGGTA